MTTELEKNLAGIEDLLSTASSTPVAQLRLDNTGAEVSYNITPINSSSLKASTATQALHASLASSVTLHDVFSTLITGGAFQYASDSQNGQMYRTSFAPSVANQPIAFITDDPKYNRILTAAQFSAAGLVTTQSISLPHTASATNAYTTANQVRDEHAAQWGTGKDGAFKTGTITDPATAPSALSTSTTGGFIPADAGGYTYKVTFGNATGETLPSSASAAQITTGATSTISMTLPTGGTNCAWRKIYRDEGSSSWKLVGYIPDNTTTSWTDTQQYVSSTAAPGANTADTSWDAPSGEYHFDGDMTWPAVTLGGDITVRCRGIVTISGAITGTGLGGGKSVLTPTGRFDGGGGSGSGYVMHCPPGGFGTQYKAATYPGAGTSGGVQTGTGGVAGTGGLPGATICIFAHEIRIAEAITSNGAAGVNGTGTTNYSAGGGGGGAAGIVWLVARDAITSGTHTVTLVGGAGGNGSGEGGANTAYGGYGGAGGLFFASAPILELANLTVTKTAGAVGSNDATSIGTMPGGQGGSCSGDGGAYVTYSANSVIAFRAATAGQSVTTTQFATGGLR